MANSTKRYVERSSSVISHNMAASVTNSILHNVSERETLVRTILDLDIHSVNGGSKGAYAIELSVEPSGVAVHSPANGESLGNSIPKEVIWQKNGNFGATDQRERILIDLKSMRKLNAGDELVFRDIAANASSINVTGNVTIFLKQT